MRKKDSSPKTLRRGMTLIELLVVAGLMALIVMISVPVMRPVAADRAAREAIRGFQAALETARMRAAKLERPCGVALVPYHAGDMKFPCVSVRCDQVSCPPNYHGDLRGSVCKIGDKQIKNNMTLYPIQLYNGDQLAPNNDAMTAQGNWIRINHAGPWFQFYEQGLIRLPRTTTKEDGNTVLVEFVPFWSELTKDEIKDGFKYTIRRYPISNAASAFNKVLGLDQPLALPRGVVIDLYYSGVGTAGTEYTRNYDPSDGILCSKWGNRLSSNKYPDSDFAPIMIMFNPSGGVELYYYGHSVIVPAVLHNQNTSDFSPKIFLLVGLWNRGLREPEGVAYLPPDGLDNLADPGSFWLVLNSRTGLVTSARNNPDPNGNVVNAREFAKLQLKGIGGR